MMVRNTHCRLVGLDVLAQRDLQLPLFPLPQILMFLTKCKKGSRWT
uniref:Uncharacterized protein n=1 Tax=Setaria italica TaxID=4555 RepID=K3ZFV8_SETIT